MRNLFSLVVGLVMLPMAVLAQDTTTYVVNGTYDDAEFNMENAIIDRGLVVDLTSHVSTMLERTGPDVGDTTKLLEHGTVFMFCSAVLSRKMIAADPLNASYCPYGIFIIEPADGSGIVTVGYRNLPAGPMQDVQSLLDDIAREVADQ